jgi:exopolysaccharide biosynthesis protein
MVSITSGTSKISNLVIDADLNLAGYDLKTDDIKESTGAAGVTIDGVLVKDSELKTDVIHEKTGTAGVTVDGALIKDGGAASSASNFTVDGNIDMGAHDLKTDDIKESSAGHGVDIDGMVVKDNIILTIDAVGGSVIPKEVSDNLRNSHDAEISDQTGASYVKQKTITFTNGIKGNLRMVWR